MKMIMMQVTNENVKKQVIYHLSKEQKEDKNKDKGKAERERERER